MILRECVEQKYDAQARHFALTGGDPVLYAKLLRKTYRAAIKRRAQKREPVAAK